jgi:hypothetical protein
VRTGPLFSRNQPAFCSLQRRGNGYARHVSTLASSSSRLQRYAPWLLACAALLLLLLGTAVYVLDRPAASAALLPAAWERSVAGVSWFGSVGEWLPSFVHAFSFSIFTALVLPPSPRRAAWACGSWALVDSLAELGQHHSVAAALAAALLGPDPTRPTNPVLATLARYFSQGSFDICDLAAGLTGAGLAYLGLHWIDSRRTLQPPMRARRFQGER